MIHRTNAPRAMSALLLVAALAAGSACGPGGGERKTRAPGSAVWVDPRIGGLAPAAARSLRAAGVEEVFVAAAALVESESGGQEGLSLEPWNADLGTAVPPRTPVTLAAVGSWPPVGALDPDVVAQSLVPRLVSLRSTAEGAGLLPIGIHFHFEPNSRGASEAPRLALLAGILEEVREALPEELLLSVSLGRPWLEAEGIEELVRAADFVVPFLYGDPPGASDRPESWDPLRIEEDLATLEALETDHLLGARTVGSAELIRSSGEVAGVTTRAALRPLAENPNLRRTIGDAVAGVGRLVYQFQAQRRTTGAGWELPPGATVRVVRTAPSLLHAVRLRAEAAGGEGFLGLLIHRVPGAEESLSVGPREIAAAFEEEPPKPDLRANLAIVSRGAQTVVLGVGVRNGSALSTDLALGDGNYLTLRATNAVIERVEPGDFGRYSLWRDGVEVRPGVDWRDADEVRLLTPMIEGGQRLGGARVALRQRPGGTEVRLAGRFYLPDGRELEIEPAGGALETLPFAE